MTNLTDAQRERLAMLAEEAAEVIQVIGKILRHGYDSYHPNDILKTPNRKFLQEELMDFDSIMTEMASKGDIRYNFTNEEIKARWNSKKRWTHHQGKDE